METFVTSSNKLNFHIDNEVSKRNYAQGVRVMKQTPLKNQSSSLLYLLRYFTEALKLMT